MELRLRPVGLCCKTSSNIATCQEAGHLEIGGDGDEEGHGEAEHRGVGAAVAVALHLVTQLQLTGALSSLQLTDCRCLAPVKRMSMKEARARAALSRGIR